MRIRIFSPDSILKVKVTLTVLLFLSFAATQILCFFFQIPSYDGSVDERDYSSENSCFFMKISLQKWNIRTGKWGPTWSANTTSCSRISVGRCAAHWPQNYAAMGRTACYAAWGRLLCVADVLSGQGTAIGFILKTQVVWVAGRKKNSST